MARNFWDRWAGLYDLAQRANSKVNREMVRAAAARIPAGADVLDCAAGTGTFSMAAAPRAARVLCTDLSLPMLDRARSKAEQLGLGNISFAPRDLLNLEDPDGTYGAVVAANVLHLLPEPGGAVRELWRVVRPGGVLLYSTCTILPRENAGVMAAFLAGHPEFSPEPLALPDGIAEDAPGMVTLLPHKHGTDGFYICKLRRAL